MPLLQTPLKIYNSIPKIFLGQIKNLVIVIFVALFYLNANFNNPSFSITLKIIGLLILIICFYQFILAFKYSLQIKKNYLLIDKNGLTQHVLNQSDVVIYWQDITKMYALPAFDKFLLKTDKVIYFTNNNAYSNLYPNRKKKKKNAEFNLILSAKYLDIHIKDFEAILEKYLSGK